MSAPQDVEAGRSQWCQGALLSPGSGQGCHQPLQCGDVSYPMRSQGEDSWIRNQCLQVGNAYVIVYSITDRGSFESASELRIQLRRARQAEDIPIILVGNKSDLVRRREVSVEGEWFRMVWLVRTPKGSLFPGSPHNCPLPPPIPPLDMQLLPCVQQHPFPSA